MEAEAEGWFVKKYQLFRCYGWTNIIICRRQLEQWKNYLIFYNSNCFRNNWWFCIMSIYYILQRSFWFSGRVELWHGSGVSEERSSKSIQIKWAKTVILKSMTMGKDATRVGWKRWNVAVKGTLKLRKQYIVQLNHRISARRRRTWYYTKESLKGGAVRAESL